MIDASNNDTSSWITSVQYGNGDGFPTYYFQDGYYKTLEPIISNYKNGNKFLVIINNGFSEKIGDRLTFQKMYEIQRSMDGFLEPTRLVEKVKTLIEKLGIDQEEFKQNSQNVFKNKNNVPLKQLFALYAINKIASKVNMNE